ncbi:MAG: hypothetical protein DI626_08165, partial [Micavibrio aeruginosavorus]
LVSYIIYIICYSLRVGTQAGDLTWGIGLTLLNAFLVLNYTFIPALIVAFLFTKRSVINWIESHKIAFILITAAIISCILAGARFIKATKYANGYFAINWDKFFRHFDRDFMWYLFPFLVYTLLITYRISNTRLDQRK